jgi:hypothetical protein
MTDKTALGVVFVFGAFVVFAVWHTTKNNIIPASNDKIMQGESPNNPVTINSGLGVVPELQVSNSPEYNNDDDWSTPYYLRANYPADRELGSMVMQSQVNGSIPQFGPTNPIYSIQDINPSL